MTVSSDDTIFAPASGHGRAAICVIRISGRKSRFILETIAAPLGNPRSLVFRRLRDPQTGEVLDEGMAVWFPGPKTFTGEDQAELHIHGGLAVRTGVLKALAAVSGCRPAEPGEFTRRAFLNGRMDLSQVEGLADLIDSETERQRKQALGQLGGRLREQMEIWRDGLLSAQALLEAALDFADEGDVPQTLEAEARGIVANLLPAMDAALTDRRGERLRDGLTVVLAGPPNAGKSTLLNALTKRDVAIVSPVAGTTRDIIEVHCDLAGLPVTLVDTAGLRDSTDPIEQEGVLRARARAAAADVVLWLMAPDGAGPNDDLAGEMRTIVVATMADKNEGSKQPAADVSLSAKTGFGMERLLDLLKEKAAELLGEADSVLTRERHRQLVAQACKALQCGLMMLENGGSTELAAEDIRQAVRAIGAITGRIDVEEVLDRLFSSFCIGK